MRTRTAGLLILATARLVSSAPIVSTFSNTPPGYVSDSYQLQAVHIGMISNNQQWAMAFAVPMGQNYQLTGIRAALGFKSTTEMDFAISLPDPVGAPGSAIETIPIFGTAGAVGIFSGDSLLHTTLIGGKTYWLAGSLVLADPNTVVTWMLPSTFSSGLGLGQVASRAVSNGPIPPNWSVVTNTQAAFEIDAVALPEATTQSMFILSGSFAAIAFLYRRASRR